MNDLITIVVPIYNVEPYLKKSIDSIINQTYQNLEIILVDDGSPDNSGKICDEYAKKDNRIKVIHKENGGLSSARNAGIDMAKGKYISFVDSDDYISNDYIEYMYNILKKYNVKMSTCETQVIYGNENIKEKEKNVVTLLDKSELFYNILFDKKSDVSAYSKLYHISLFENIRFPNGIVYEDTATTYKLIEKCDKIATGSKKCYYYYYRLGSISKSRGFNKNELDYIKNTAEMLSYLRKHYPHLASAINRYELYSNFRILRLLIFTLPRNYSLEKQTFENIKKLRKVVFKYADTPKRDKIAIIISYFGINVFKMVWGAYCKFTKRIN